MSSLWLDAHMDLKTYIEDPERRQALAEAIPASPDYLWQIATGWKGRKPSPKLALAIERETGRIGPEAVRKESLLPEVWPPAEAA